jgi:DNA repair exonuclease SbcCD ATPase subunit
MEEAREQNHDLASYKACLLKRLEEQARRSSNSPIDGPSGTDLVQVLVNGQRIGWLSTNKSDAAVRFHCRGSVDYVELRSEDGFLLGGLLAPERGVRFTRIALGRDWVELSIANTAGGALISAIYHAVPNVWRRLVGQLGMNLARIVGVADSRPVASPLASSLRLIAITQVALTLSVVWLAADRLSEWMRREGTSTAVTRAEVAKMEQQIDALARLQAEAVDTIQSQQQGMAQLQSAIVELSSAQESVASSVMTVKKEIELRRKKSGREVERMARLLISRAQVDQQQLEAEIRNLTVANERLSKEMTRLIEQNNDLMKRLKTMEVDVSKQVIPRQEPIMTVAQEDDQRAVDVAQTLPQPFLFWVHFHDGTPEEHIEQWVQEMQGRRGGIEEGWQEVQVMQLDLPTDRFLEQVKGAKIVKAVRLAR